MAAPVLWPLRTGASMAISRCCGVSGSISPAEWWCPTGRPTARSPSLGGTGRRWKVSSAAASSVRASSVAFARRRRSPYARRMRARSRGQWSAVVITETGTDPRVSALVYIAAFAPDKGESANTLIADPSQHLRHEARLRTQV